MKTIKIPYKYNLNRTNKHILCIDLNNGITLCKKLGFIPNLIILGKKESKEIENFAASGTIKQGKELVKEFDRINIKINHSNKKNELIFCCNKLFKI